ncbi:MAG: histidine phosphatase family protein [Thiohalobacterales bacterium]|nr:histidine phosphatase family protein [Thiohalobacterales bacterium]
MPDTCAPETTIELLRHGEPVGGSRFRGRRDDPLSELGWQQMRAAVAGRDDWQHIITSPLLRCRAFADTLASELALPLSVEERFAEVGFGEWEGKSRSELEELIPGQVTRFYRDPVLHRPPGAEPLADFCARVTAGFETLLERHAGQAVLVVAHAGVIRAIIAAVLSMEPVSMYRINVANAGLTRLRTDRLRRFNFEAHGRV